MQLESRTLEEVTIVEVKGARLDAAAAVELRKQSAEVINDGGMRVVLDLSEIEFVDSSGLGALLSVMKSVGHRGSLSMTGVRPQVMQLFELTRMDKIFRLYPSVEEAVAAA